MKQVKIIARVQYKTSGIVVYHLLSSNGKDKYKTTLFEGKATHCTCPSRKPCYHMSQLEHIEAARSQQGVTPAVATVATMEEAMEEAQIVMQYYIDEAAKAGEQAGMDKLALARLGGYEALAATKHVANWPSTCRYCGKPSRSGVCYQCSARS